LLPLLYKHFSAVCPDQIPTKTLENLKQFYRFNSIQSLQKFRSLIQIVNLLEGNDIKVLSVKGPLFTLCYLGDISLRTSCDIDILVSQQDFVKAVTLLKSIGCSLLPKNIPEQYFFKFAKNHHHGQLVDKDGVLVELHWELSGHYGARSLDFDTLEPFRESYEIQGYKISTLCQEMLIVYLAIHAQRHCWQRYDYLLCLAEVLNNTNKVNWHKVTELALKLKIEKVVFLAVFMTSDLLDAAVDKKYLQENRYFHLLPELVTKHQDNWQHINQTVIKRHKVGLQEWRKVYPEALKFTGRICDVIWQYYSKCFLPEAADWERFPVPYQTSVIYYLSRPVYKLSRVFRKYK
jgi:hypothetical protein